MLISDFNNVANYHLAGLVFHLNHCSNEEEIFKLCDVVINNSKEI